MATFKNLIQGVFNTTGQTPHVRLDTGCLRVMVDGKVVVADSVDVMLTGKPVRADENGRSGWLLGSGKADAGQTADGDWSIRACFEAYVLAPKTVRERRKAARLANGSKAVKAGPKPQVPSNSFAEAA